MLSTRTAIYFSVRICNRIGKVLHWTRTWTKFISASVSWFHLDALLWVYETTFSRSNHSVNSIFSSRHVARNDFVWNYPVRQVCVHCVLGVKTRLSSPLTDKKLLETNLLYLHTLTCYVVARPHFGDIFTFGAYCYILSSSTYVRHKTAHLGANSNAQECEWSWSSYKTNHLIIIENRIPVL